MAVNIRQATVDDLPAIQNANLHNLPENYLLKYYLYHILSWPQASYVATTTDLDGLVDGEQETRSYSQHKIDEAKSDPSYLNPKEKIVGYILGKMDDDPDAEDKTPHGHVTSISIIRTYRRMGIAGKLMRQSLYAMCEVYGASYVGLHVRKSNRAALHLYRDTLQFEVLDLVKSYYADEEDAYHMKKVLVLEDLVPSLFQGSELVDDCVSDLFSDDEEVEHIVEGVKAL